jgi:hypothetical protein
MLYVLARAGRAKPDKIKELIESTGSGWKELSEENMFLLKAALYLSGDRTYEDDLRQAKLSGAEARVNDYSYWSALRTRGLMLNILEDLFPDSPQTEALAQSITERLKQKSEHYNTQELSWCVSGLGKRAAAAAGEWSKPLLHLDAEAIEPVPKKIAKGNETTWLISGASRATKLLLSLESIKEGSVYAMVRVEGVKPGSSYISGDNGIKVERNYRTQDGAQVDLSKVRLGDIVYVELSLKNLTNVEVHNVALVDRFPAGMEIENPRLNKEHAAAWIVAKNLWEADYINMRDDRVELFGGLKPNQTVMVYYVVRATLGGRYQTPPVRAEVMYDPKQFSQKLGKKVTILDPWNAISD